MNHAGRNVLVPPIGFEHGALAFVGHHLGLFGEVLDTGGFAVARLESLPEDFHIAELPAAGVVIPILVDRPEMVCRNEFAKARDGRDGRPRAGLGVEAVCAPALFVLEPVRGSDVFVRPSHLHARVPGDRGRLGRRGGLKRVGPVVVLEDLDVHLFDFFRRRIVAAVQPVEQAGVAAQPPDLVFQRFRRDGEVFVFPALPSLPVVAAAPAGQHHNSVAVAKIEEVVVLELPLQPDGVEVQVAKVSDVVLLYFGRGAEQHVERVAAATDQDVFPVDFEEARALGRKF